MAQPGNFTPILLYSSSTPTNVPLAANLTNSATGSEIAINVADKNLFFKDSGGVVNTVPIRQSSTSSNGWLSSTDWNTFNNKAPATSGTSILYGNGSGGFSNVTIGTGLTFIGGTLASTASGGTVTSVAATVPAFLSISGSPITTSGTLAITLSGTALPVANGGTGLTTLTANYIPYGNGTSAFSSSANLTFDGTTLTAANNASIAGLTIGKGAGSGTGNTAIGVSALAANTAGNNTAIGYQAGISVTSGSPNDCFGSGAGGGVTTGNNNVLIGFKAGNFAGGAATLTTGSQNIYIGTAVNSSSSSVTYETTIGFNATGKGASTTFIGSNGAAAYQANNSATWSITSDKRLKKNIVDNEVGLSAIIAIQVRNFEYRTKDEITELEPQNAINIKGVQLGAIAQEIQSVLPDCVKIESTGVMSVDTSNFIWYLINAVKELNAKIEAQSLEISALKLNK